MKKGVATQSRDALMSSEIFEKHRYNLKLNSHKLLIGLIQNIDHETKMFDEVGYDINGLFKFLNIENRNDRYEVLRGAFADITRNPLEIKESRTKWAGVPWLGYEYDEEKSNFVKISFTPQIKPYLLDFQKYIHLKGRYITAFSSDYAISLYPVFRWVLEAYHGKHDLSFDRLKEITFTDDPKKHPSYNVNKSATNNFLRKVIGVQMNDKTKKIKILKDSPLLEINEKSDLVVNVLEFVKVGRKYTGLKIHVTQKRSNKKAAAVQKVPEGGMAHYRVPLKEFYEQLNGYNKGAKAAGEKELNIQEYADKSNFYIHSGYAHKKMSEKERNQAILSRDAREKDKEKRSRQTETLTDIFDRINRGEKNNNNNEKRR